MPRPTQTPASNSDARKRNAEKDQPGSLSPTGPTSPTSTYSNTTNAARKRQAELAREVEAATEDVIERAARVLARLDPGEDWPTLPLHRTEAGWPNCATCDGGGCLDCTDPA